MSRPYNLKTVQDAILICDLMASNLDGLTFEICDALGLKYSCGAVKLAYKAEAAVNELLKLEGSEEEQWAEASCLLREGWGGEPLVKVLTMKVTAHYEVIAAEPDDCQWDGSDPVTEVLFPHSSEPFKVYTDSAQKRMDVFAEKVNTCEKFNAAFPGQGVVTFSDTEKRQIDAGHYEVSATDDD